MMRVADRRREPRIDGMVVTEPAPLDDGQGGGCAVCGGCNGCGAKASGAGALHHAPCPCAAQCGAGNVWFSGAEPDEEPPMETWAVATLALVLMASAVGSFALLTLGFDALRGLLGGAL